MKLIDLLVQELPDRGGWPKGVDAVEQDSKGQLFEMDYGYCSDFKLEKCDDWIADVVSKQQYESALAASKKSAWSGEDLPPVGCECEVSVDGGRSWCTYRAINEKNGVRLIEIGNLTEEFQNNNWIFRPLRIEAKRKRDAAIEAMQREADEGDNWIYSEYEIIYDAIAAGKIPGVKLED